MAVGAVVLGLFLLACAAVSLFQNEFVYPNAAEGPMDRRSPPGAIQHLKGNENIYNSKNTLRKTIGRLPDTVVSSINGKIIYAGSTGSMEYMGDIYNALDAYVTPYRSEGFNIPPLEAAACGIPIICTRGGSTDDFLDSTFAQFIESRALYDPKRPPGNKFLEADVDHLIHLMSQMIEDHSWRQHASLAGPQHVRAKYTWSHVVDQLLAIAA